MRLEKWWGPVVLEARLLPLSFYPMSSEQKSSGGAGSMPAAPELVRLSEGERMAA